VKAAGQFLGISKKLRITPLGIDEGEVRAGFTWEVLETALVAMRLHDANGKTHEYKLPGTTTLNELCESVRANEHIRKWNKIEIKRTDGKPILGGRKRTVFSVSNL
jgi:hypothetical protein